MASGDVYTDPGGRYINVYPISTRHTAVGFFFMLAFGSSPTWPPEDDPNPFTSEVGDDDGKQVFIGYADDHPNVPPFSGDEPSSGIFYQDEFASSTVRVQADSSSYGVTQALWFWDLTGLPVSQVERAEVVTEIQVHPMLLSGTRDLLLTWHNDYTTPYGYEVGPADFESQRSGNAARISTQTLLDVRSGAIANPHPDTTSFEDPALVEWWGAASNWETSLYALPLEDLGQLRAGQVGLAWTLDQPSAPSSGTDESLNFFGFFGDYDSLIDDHGLHVAGFRLPFLRLWLPIDEDVEPLPIVDVAADMEIGLEIGGRVSVDAGPALFHRAKLIRGY